jgi:predicted ATPase
MRSVGTSRRLRAYAYGLVTTAIVLVLALAEWWIEKYVSDRSRLAGTTIEASIVVVAALVFRPIHQRVERAVEAAFTKRSREAREALSRLRKELTSFNEAQQVLRRVVEATEHHMGAAGCAIYLRRETYRAEASTFDVPIDDVGLDDPLTIRLRSTAAAADPRALGSSAVGELAFPMMAGGDLIGFLCLTPQRIEYEPDDSRAIATLAEAAGLALLALDPRLRSLNALAPTNNLPRVLTSLVGRENETADIASLVGEHRIVTIVGAGGVGKTRTSLQVAANLLTGFADGVWFVDLAPLHDPVLVPSAIADVFSVADEGGPKQLIDRVIAALKTQQLLIVLDNCEHVISAAADAADRLLRACPGVRILATSREALGIVGEESYRMPTLSVPPEGEHMTADRVMQYAAAALFVARAHTAQRSFALTDENAEIVADIVRRLDGIALAIELAAPRVKVLSLDQLGKRLDERFKLLTGGGRNVLPRQQTLFALIGWSYDLLSEAERSLLRQSGIFRGSWTLEAAEAICIDERFDDWNALDLLSSLVDKSLVGVESEGEEQRYRMLESTRQFASERLTQAGEREDVAARHCGYFAQIAQRADEAFWRTDSDLWAAQVRRDLENYRAAVGWGLDDNGNAEAAATIVASLRGLWVASLRREGQTLIDRAAAALASDAPARVRGLLALAIARLNHTSAQAATPAAEAARLLGGIDEVGRVEALAFQGGALGRAGHPEGSAAILEHVLAARATRTPRLIGWVLSTSAYWIGAAGDRARARPLFDEAAVLLRGCNDLRQLAMLQVNRAEFLFADGDLEGALACVREAETIYRKRTDESGLTQSLLNKAAYLLALERFDEAWTAAREGLGLALRVDQAFAVTVGIAHLAHLAAESGDPVRAARMLGYCDAVYLKLGNIREPTEQQSYGRTLELIHAALPEERMSALTNEGAAMEQDAAAIEAMAVPQPPASQVSLSA